ncbi:N-formylglutamate amidohydrolase [Hyphobacterium marinum]|uniref:N-formylglutamate amidohydrolase n=1 Tax=Hyphobacterium marinum TaxID=3116574 RepID=A0ABU7LZ81_9PROT|nr:N-formylglutamate amidohydrolase [Hyphobacterium sp. Y6023]MEE2566500.1 N-formylglutamate amidohydrolase [Hyphobacterium sp. Y6023]
MDAASSLRVETLTDAVPTADTAADDGPVSIRRPETLRAPLVFASPHSGRRYSDAFLQDTALSLVQLRRSEDAYIDELFSAAPACGAPMVRANFPRVYLDPNRAIDEIDPQLFIDAPRSGNTPSPRTRAGLGVIPRIGAEGEPVYPHRLPISEATDRLDRLYRPYHEALEEELAAVTRAFGFVILIDAHSMPSRGNRHIDIVIGDRHGASAAPGIVDQVEAAARNSGFRTARNEPYAGGHSTEFYGRPLLNRHAVQIEVNRALYLNESDVTRSGTFETTRTRLTAFIADLCSRPWGVELR